MIDTQPAANPLDVPSPKASEIVRNWPQKMWCAQNAKQIEPDGSVSFCVIGIIGETGGFEWSAPDAVYVGGPCIWRGFSCSPVSEFVKNKLGVSAEDIEVLYSENDHHGKDAAADLLASWGL